MEKRHKISFDVPVRLKDVMKAGLCLIVPTIILIGAANAQADTSVRNPTVSPTPRLASQSSDLFSVIIDGKVALDGGNKFFPVASTIVPLIVIKINIPAYKKYDWKSNTSIVFSERADGVTPVMDRSILMFDEVAMTLSYQVPFDKEKFVYAGDQWIDVTVKPPNGPAIQKSIPFAVGMRTLKEGVPGIDGP